AGYQFTGWSGNVVSTANPLTFALSSPATITANFSATPASVTIASNVPAQFVIGGLGCPAGTYVASTNVVWTNGTACSVTATTPQGGPDTRQVFAGWTDGCTANPRSIAASPGAVYAMQFTPEHKLVRTVSGQGGVSGSDGYYAVGSSVQLTATPADGYQFAYWSGSASGNANPLTLTVDGPKNITANFTAAPVGIRIDSNVTAQFV